MSARQVAILRAIGAALYFVVVLVIAWRVSDYSYEAFRTGRQTMLLQWKLWPFYFAISALFVVSAWIIAPPEDDRVLGSISLRPHAHMADIGYVLARDEWGKGYMPEAARAVIDRALAVPGVFRVWATCNVENDASARVLEKIGMVREGTLRRYAAHSNLSDEPSDAFIYAIVR